jgi:phytoene dehydrogenase-like protein
MKNNIETLNENWDIVVIGSGIGSLTTASLLANEGKQVLVLERNYLPGGCVSSYYRKGFIFETGATTLVGLDDNMPVKYLLDKIGVSIDAIELETPMKVYLNNGEILTRHKDLNQFIAEAERVFGKKNQRPFWEYCFKIANFVWETSLKQRTFPPSKLADLIPMIQNFEFKQLAFAKTAFSNMKSLLEKYDLLENQIFVDFINEQLLITAQNHIEEVNLLFGSTALCYTNFGNYYVKGGLINLVQPLCDFIESKGGKVMLRVGAETVTPVNGHYEITLDRKGEGKKIIAQKVISGIPINNTLEVFKSEKLTKKYEKSILPSEKLVSAFGMGIGFYSDKKFDCIHHQIHLDKPLPHCNSNSIFLSLNHETDSSRTPEKNQYVANISTHVHHPEANYQFDRTEVENIIFDTLEKQGFLKRSDVVYYHSSMPSSWENWIYRKYGFVGGYPQYFNIKPWQMLDARLDGKGAYICGDTTYPGQGIPGAALSGIIAFEKIMRDSY